MFKHIPTNLGLAGLYIVFDGSSFVEEKKGTSHLIEHIICKNYNHLLPKLAQFDIESNAYTANNEVVDHYAGRVWPRSHYGSIQAHGHSHGNLEPIKNQYDVGVDNNNFYPVSLEELKEKVKYQQIFGYPRDETELKPCTEFLQNKECHMTAPISKSHCSGSPRLI